jgi:hypothetical protein
LDLEGISMSHSDSPYDRVSVIVAAILIGTVLLGILEIPPRVFQFRPLGTPLTFNVTATWAVSALLVGLACAGTEAVLRTHPMVRRGIVERTFPNWILPALTTLALTVLLPRSPDVLNWLLGLVIGGGILAWLILMSYEIIPLGTPRETSIAATAQLGLRLAAYPLALILFSSIYRTRLRSLVTGTAVAAVAALLSLSILYFIGPGRQPLGRTFFNSGIIGLILGETTWALNYWQADAMTVGVLLMILFYVLTGIVREYTRAGIRWRTVAEFLVVAALGVVIAFQFGPK